jgi:hypothetical protein
MERNGAQDDPKEEPTVPLAAPTEASKARSLWPAAVIIFAIAVSLTWSIFLIAVVARAFGMF